ncbi:MAG: helix-hairpin-helix domain-containing protein, partial [Alkalibacterium sp.]|nr:helix-hairpin-helix domain-containing protein [Alkalibacterium sp.]
MNQIKYIKEIGLGVLFFSVLLILYFSFLKNSENTDHMDDVVTLETLVEDGAEDGVKEKQNDIENKLDIEEAPSISSEVVIDIKGAVKKPGVFSLETTERVIDAVDAAGGVLENADTKHINFAQMLEDEMYIYIPEIGEEISQTVDLETKNQIKGEMININHADENDFATLDGIGPSKAAAIIDYRDENGSFKTIEDLLNVTGIGEKTFDKIKERLKVN